MSDAVLSTLWVATECHNWMTFPEFLDFTMECDTPEQVMELFKFEVH